MKTLDQFVQELRDEVTAFEKRWRQRAIKDPEGWPLELEDEDEGSWWEQFQAFREEINP